MRVGGGCEWMQAAVCTDGMAIARNGTERQRLKRWLTVGAGFLLLAVGGALLVLPGPGIPFVLGGLALLGRELPWAKRLRDRLHEKVREKMGRRPLGSTRSDEA